jgi:NarL family two-component system response regulator LiaR
VGLVNKDIRVLIVDNHAFMREGLRAYLSSHDEFIVVGSAASGEEAIDLVKKYLPEVVLMEIIFTGMNGTEVIKHIKLKNPKTQVVVLTNSNDEKKILSAFKAGATTILFKDVKMEKLVDAIRDSAMGEPTIHPRVAFLILEKLSPRNGACKVLGLELSTDDIAMLNLIAKGFSNRKIADELSIDENEVNNQELEILRKLRNANPTHVRQDSLIENTRS